jgi:hypothetical protein
MDIASINATNRHAYHTSDTPRIILASGLSILGKESIINGEENWLRSKSSSLQ